MVFDPDKIQDNSTYKDPHHYATGIPYVLMSGVPVIKNGEHTSAKAGQALRHVCAPKQCDSQQRRAAAERSQSAAAIKMGRGSRYSDAWRGVSSAEPWLLRGATLSRPNNYWLNW